MLCAIETVGMKRNKSATVNEQRTAGTISPQTVYAHETTGGWLAALIFLTVLLVAYFPALNGGQIWDDDAHFTNPQLRSFHGLVQIWANPEVTQQYYPLVHSAFWLEHKLWGISRFRITWSTFFCTPFPRCCC